MPTVWAQPSSVLTRRGGSGGDGGGARGACAHLHDGGGNVGCARRNRGRRCGHDCRWRGVRVGGRNCRPCALTVDAVVVADAALVPLVPHRGEGAGGVGRARHHRCRRRRERLAPAWGGRLGSLKSWPPAVAAEAAVAAALVRATATRPARAGSRGPRPHRTAAEGVTARRLVPTLPPHPGDDATRPALPKFSSAVRLSAAS